MNAFVKKIVDEIGLWTIGYVAAKIKEIPKGGSLIVKNVDVSSPSEKVNNNTLLLFNVVPSSTFGIIINAVTHEEEFHVKLALETRDPEETDISSLFEIKWEGEVYKPLFNNKDKEYLIPARSYAYVDIYSADWKVFYVKVNVYDKPL